MLLVTHIREKTNFIICQHVSTEIHQKTLFILIRNVLSQFLPHAKHKSTLIQTLRFQLTNIRDNVIPSRIWLQNFVSRLS